MHLGQEQTDRQRLWLEVGFAGPLQCGLQLGLGLGGPACLQLDQGHQLQSLDLVGSGAEQLAQFPFRPWAIVLVTAQLGQQQPQLPALVILVGHALQPRDGLSSAIECDQQFQQPLLLSRAGLALVHPADQLGHVPIQARTLAVLRAGPAAVQLAEPPAQPQAGGRQSGHTTAQPKSASGGNGGHPAGSLCNGASLPVRPRA